MVQLFHKLAVPSPDNGDRLDALLLGVQGSDPGKGTFIGKGHLLRVSVLHDKGVELSIVLYRHAAVDGADVLLPADTGVLIHQVVPSVNGYWPMAHHYHFGEGKALGHKIVVFAALPRLLLLQGGRRSTRRGQR